MEIRKENFSNKQGKLHFLLAYCMSYYFMWWHTYIYHKVLSNMCHQMMVLIDQPFNSHISQEREPKLPLFPALAVLPTR